MINDPEDMINQFKDNFLNHLTSTDDEFNRLEIIALILAHSHAMLVTLIMCEEIKAKKIKDVFMFEEKTQ